MKTMKRMAACALLALGILPAAGMAQVGPYPTKPIRVIVPFGPGSAPDILARMVAQDLSDSVGSALVENRPSASGLLGVEYVAKSPSDGYTLLLGMTATQTINPSLYTNIPYDPLRDFTPVAMLAYAPFVVVLANDVPAKTIHELIALAKKDPGKLTFASAGSGSMNGICFELIKARAGIDVVQVPYKGIALGVPDVISGRVSIMCNSVAALLPHIKSGKMRAIVTADLKRSAILPGLPTLAEEGLAGTEVASWYAVYGPAGLPSGITETLNAQVRKMLTSARTRERFLELGLNSSPMTPEELAEVTRRDLQKWAKVLKDFNIKAD